MKEEMEAIAQVVKISSNNSNSSLKQVTTVQQTLEEVVKSDSKIKNTILKVENDELNEAYIKDKNTYFLQYTKEEFKDPSSK